MIGGSPQERTFIEAHLNDWLWSTSAVTVAARIDCRPFRRHVKFPSFGQSFIAALWACACLPGQLIPVQHGGVVGTNRPPILISRRRGSPAVDHELGFRDAHSTVRRQTGAYRRSATHQLREQIFWRRHRLRSQPHRYASDRQHRRQRLVQFDLGRCPRERPKNSRAARLIHEGGDGVVTVIEHTNAKKENVHNGKLLFPTVRRVVVWLSGPGGVPGNRLKPDGYSEAEPVSPNSTSDGQDDNVLMCRCGPRSSGAFECPSRAAGFRQA